MPPVKAVFKADASGAGFRSRDAAYADARSGLLAGLYVYASNTDNYPVGQRYDAGEGHTCYQSCLKWNTASLPDDAPRLASWISLYRNTDLTVTDFILEARAYDWGETVDTGDFIPGASLSASTLLASLNTNVLSGDGYYDLASEAALLSAINTSGYTYVNLSSSRQRIGDVPTGDERWHPYSEDKGAGYEPLLTVIYDWPAMTPLRGMW